MWRIVMENSTTETEKKVLALVTGLLTAACMVISFGFVTTASAGMTIYPAKGHSPQQQQKDEFECHQWARL